MWACCAVWSSDLCVYASGGTQVVDERTVTLGFHQWLASVTERIHQTMHYQFDGKAKEDWYPAYRNQLDMKL